MNVHEEKEFSTNYDLSVWKNLFQYLKPFRKNFIILAFYMIILAVIDAGTPLLTKYAIDYYIAENTLDGIEYFIALYAVVIIFISGIVYLFIKD